MGKKVILIIAETTNSELICPILSALGGVLGAYLEGKFDRRFALFGVRSYEMVRSIVVGSGLQGGITPPWK